MLRRPKHSKNKVVAPKEEEENVIQHKLTFQLTSYFRGLQNFNLNSERIREREKDVWTARATEVT